MESNRSWLGPFLTVVLLSFAPKLSPSVELPRQNPKAKTLIIVAPSMFRDALQTYVDFKNKILPTELVSLEEALQAGQGSDDPEKLKHYLYDRWVSEKQLGYVLLVGDCDVMPVRYTVTDRRTPAAFNYAFYPSDLYYANLATADGSFDDWNAQKQGFHAKYFGEVRGEFNKTDPINFDRISYHPQIAVGRWPVSTVTQLQIVVTKSMTYEDGIRHGTHPGMRVACLVNVFGWQDYREHFALLPLPGWEREELFFTDKNPNFKTPPPDEAHIVDELNRGTALCVHVGHGGVREWAGIKSEKGFGPPAFSYHSLQLIKNADRLPIMMSVGCSTNYFAPLGPYEAYVDVDGVAHTGTNHGEVFTSPPPPPSPYQKERVTEGLGKSVLRDTPNGAVAYIGCNTGGQGCALTLVEGFFAALNNAQSPRLGDCWSSAINYYYNKQKLATIAPNESWYPPTIFHEGTKYMLFGDPSLPLAPKK